MGIAKVMERIRYPIIGYCILVIFSLCQFASADIDQGKVWLQAQQKVNGEYSHIADSATTIQSTSETLTTLKALNVTTDANQAKARLFVRDYPLNNTEWLARKIIAQHEAGLPFSTFITTLNTHQNRDGGFGDEKGSESTVWDTAWALKALFRNGQIDTHTQQAINWLINQQNAAGLWSTQSSVEMTALALEALWLYRHQFQLTTVLDKATQTLLNLRQAGQWASTTQTSIVLLAVLPRLSALNEVQPALNALENAQAADGSFNNDVFTTALALRALLVSKMLNTNPDLASFTGKIIDAQSRLALPNIRVNLTGGINQTLNTDNTGQFTFTALPAGIYQLEIPVQGEYQRVQLDISLGEGQHLDAGLILLNRDVNPTTAMITGKVTQAENGNPLAGVQITAGSLTAVTDNQGNYQIIGVSPGAFTLTAALSGFKTAIGQVEVEAGEAIVFSPALVASNISANQSEIVGNITNAITGLPLENVTVSVSGAFDTSVQTDNHGDFIIQPISAIGQITISAVLTGYVTASASTMVTTDSRIDFSPKLVPTGTAADKGRVYGQIINSSDNTPLADVTVKVGNLTTTTDVDGLYSINDVPAGIMRVIASKTGFTSASGEAVMVAGGLMEFSPPLTPLTTVPTASAIFGTVISATTGLPIAGAEIYVSSTQNYSTQTALDGSYRLENLPAGNYSVVISYPDYEQATVNFDLPAQTEMAFSPALDIVNNLVITPNSATLSGRLLDSVTGLPVETAIYTVSGSSRERGVNRYGRFNIIGITSTTVTITFTAPGYHPLTVQYPVTPLIQQEIGDLNMERIIAARLPDLAVATFDITAVNTDADTLAVTGIAKIAVTNQGAQETPYDIDVMIFEDRNRDGRYNVLDDVNVGTAVIAGGFTMGQTRDVNVTVNGQLRYRDAPLRLWIDSSNHVVELDENNNVDYYATGEGYTLKTYTDKTDFDLGRKINIAVDTSNQSLKLAEDMRAFDNIWIANSGLGTVLKISIETGEVLGEYRSAPNGMYKNPSRTTVDKNGNVWVGNRDESSYVIKDSIAPGLPTTDRYMGSIIKIGLLENGQCEDRNGNGVIDTSTGLGDVRDWLNPASIDSLGGNSSAEDECILEYVRVNSTGTRHISVNRHNQVWVSGTGGRYFDLVSEQGEMIRQEPSVGYGGYGGLIDANDVIWSSTGGSPLLRWDTQNPLTGPNGGNWQGFFRDSYGLCIDSKGNVWDSRGSVYRPDGSLLRTYSGGYQGCAVDYNDHVWVANINHVMHYKSDGTFVGSIYTGATGGTTGLSADANGYVWAAGGSRYVRIDPNLGAIGADGVTPIGAIDITGPDLGSGSSLYNYSDMTGSTLSGKPQQGTWSVVHDSGAANTLWGLINWHAQVLGDSHLSVTSESSNDGVNFSAPVLVTASQPLTVPSGQYLKINVHFKRASTGESPVLYDLSVRPAVPELTAAQIRVSDWGQGNPVSVDALIGNASFFDATHFIISFWKGDPATGGILLGSVNQAILAADHFEQVSLNNVQIDISDVLYVQVDSNDLYAEYNEQNNWVSGPVVVRNQNATLDVATDQPEYNANSPVLFDAFAHNLGRFAADFKVQLTVVDRQGDVVIRFTKADLGTIAANSTQIHQQPWNTGIILAGDYVLRGELFNHDNEKVAESEAPFKINALGAGSPIASLRVTTDAPEYAPNDRVLLSALAKNLTSNQLIKGAKVILSVRNPVSAEVFTHTRVIGDLPGNAQSLFEVMQLPPQAMEGDYLVQGRLEDENGGLLAVANTQYKVVASALVLINDLSGNVVVNKKVITVGETQHRDDTLQNLGTASIDDLRVARVLVADHNGSELLRHEEQVTLSVGDEKTWSRANIPTQNLAEGHYVAAILAEVAPNQWRALSIDQFRVKARAFGVGDEIEPIPLPRGLWILGTLMLLGLVFYRQRPRFHSENQFNKNT